MQTVTLYYVLFGFMCSFAIYICTFALKLFAPKNRRVIGPQSHTSVTDMGPRNDKRQHYRVDSLRVYSKKNTLTMTTATQSKCENLDRNKTTVGRKQRARAPPIAPTNRTAAARSNAIIIHRQILTSKLTTHTLCAMLYIAYLFDFICRWTVLQM